MTPEASLVDIHVMALFAVRKALLAKRTACTAEIIHRRILAGWLTFACALGDDLLRKIMPERLACREGKMAFCATDAGVVISRRRGAARRALQKALVGMALSHRVGQGIANLERFLSLFTTKTGKIVNSAVRTVGRS